MCWTCNINKLKAQIAKEDINIYIKQLKKLLRNIVYLHLWIILTIQKIYSLL